MKMNRARRLILEVLPVVFFLFPVFDCTAAGQTKPHVRRVDSNAAPAPPTNPEILRIVAGIDPANIERTIRKLVTFGTRNSLSDASSPERGIGAASEWLYGEFNKVSQ